MADSEGLLLAPGRGLRLLVLSSFKCSPLFASLLALVWACSSAPSDSGAPGSAAEFPEAFAERVCGALAGCCSDAGFDFDPADCRQDVAADIRSELAEYDGLAVDFDPQAAEACIQDYSNALCGESAAAEIDVKRNCNLMFRGRLAAGEACREDEECRKEVGQDAFCDGRNQDALSGTCVLYTLEMHPQLSEPCGGTCKGSPDDGCQSALASANDPPDDPSLPTCYTSEGLQCSGPEGSSRTCQPLVVIGESCAGNSLSCEEGAFCNLDTRICEAQSTDGPCVDVDVIGACADNAICDVLLKPDSAPGEAGHCTPLKPNGADCTYNNECESQYCGREGVCAWPEVPETACSYYLSAPP
ncbi:MAG TPA: hypothetical protein VM686_27235 [Polyangiaceae bacterium]|nr:hypothetical protein [Polyangiaceae bacterium]